MKFISTHVRLLEDQYNWLRRHCFDTGISQAEAIRLALELYRATVVEEKRTLMGRKQKTLLCARNTHVIHKTGPKPAI